MPDLVHIFLGISAGLIIIIILFMYLFSKVINQKWEPASKGKKNPNIVDDINAIENSEMPYVPVERSRFENELDEIYQKLEAIEPLDRIKSIEADQREIKNKLGEKDGAETVAKIIEEEQIIEEEKIEEKLENTIDRSPEREDKKTDGSKHQEIYRAFDSGQSITELARIFKKNKGEIELILNLRGCDDREENANGYFEL